MAEASEHMGVAAEAGGTAGRRIWTAARKAEFLAGVRAEGTMTGACRALGINPESLKGARRRNPDFDAALRAVWNKSVAQRAVQHAGAAGSAAGSPESEPANLRKFRNVANERAKFLQLMVEHGGVRTAARLLGVTTASVYEVRERDPGFRAAWERAALIYADVAESELLRKAVDGGSGGGNIRAGSAMVAQRRAKPGGALATEAQPGGPAHRAEIEVSRFELEGRLASLIERHGDPFVTDAAVDGSASPGEVAA